MEMTILTNAQSRTQPRPRASDLAETDRPLAERAATAARAELRGERAGILGAIGRPAPHSLPARARRVPECWSLVWTLSHFQ